ncbi:acyl-CoA dehydrogenase family protein [Streptosporangium sp. NBC_01755]|uniref:acyl-CoA dehydrogenase family protein n=1 Tax=unclassified Streptosporangium TaxID=2632669 RepID=UPI002DDC74FF|nr:MULTISPECIES: acyl-CoA dehydrogenase family protein [unclassified Streptosporangium]WSA29060.1 acyl-CoA dehydrogenase family protein [Streptosporangium sp. NBC_01810]WSC99493.1 acyl-CoA dehydrogenase family protein [Streptosporangium sp. NBC_01755]
MTVERVLPTGDAHDLLDLVRDLIGKEVAPRAATDESAARFPREVFTTLGHAGLLGLPYPEEHGGAAQPYEVYLQVIEELAAGWLAVGLGLSVHTLSCFPVAAYGTAEQRAALLPRMLGGEWLGAYCLSEPQSGSDAAALVTRAVPGEDGYTVDGVKAWTTHGGVADFYMLMARTSADGARGISCFHVPAETEGLSFGAPERKMGMRSSPTAQVRFDGVRLGPEALLGAEGEGFRIAMAALDGGRLGIAACAVGVAQAAFDAATAYAAERRQFGSRIIDFQGVGFMLADMATQIAAARALYLDAARLRDAGRPYGTRAAMAKLFATDMCMKVTTDAVQILGGYGYVEDFPVERHMREAKVLQIVEGTNQVQRLVISRALAR